MATPIRWIGSGGGPLLLLPVSLLPEWEGANAPAHGRVIQARSRTGGPDAPATDYDRACDVEGYLGILTIGQGTGLVLGGEPFATAWWPMQAGKEGLIVCREYGDDDLEERINEVLRAVSDDFGESVGLSFPVPNGPLYLFDSAYPGRDVGTRTTYREVQLAPGDYTLTSGFYRPDDRTSLLLHQCLLIDA